MSKDKTEMRALKQVVAGCRKNGGSLVAFSFASIASGLVLAGAAMGQDLASNSASEKNLKIAIGIIKPTKTLGESAALITKTIDSEFRYAIGDQLKIGFIELLPSIGDSTVNAGAPLSIERTELSGDYVVQVNGDVFLPIIGAVRIGNQSQAEATKRLLAGARTAINGNLKMSIVVTAREPVYVLDSTKDGASFPYRPGMVVAQAVALSGGGAAVAANDLWKHIDIAREQERMTKTAVRIQRNLAISAVLTAELSGRIPQPQRTLISMAGDIGAAQLVQAAFAKRRRQQAEELAKRESMKQFIDALKIELAAIKTRSSAVAEIVKERSAHKKAISARVKKGVSTGNRLIQAQIQLDTIENSLHELRASSAKIEYRILDLTRQRDQAELAARVSMENQLQAARDVIADDEVVMATVGQLLLKIGPVTRPSKQSRDVKYMVARRTAKGMREFSAQPLTPLAPGDMVRVVRTAGSLATASTQ